MLGMVEEIALAALVLGIPLKDVELSFFRRVVGVNDVAETPEGGAMEVSLRVRIHVLTRR